MKEIWKDIIGYEGYYQVSNLGNIRSVDRMVQNPLHGLILRKGKIKTLMTNPDGYKIVKLSKDGLDKNHFVHVLVAKMFIENKDYQDGFEINHKDLNRSNNCADNLEWVSHKENIIYSVRKGRYKHFGEDNPNYNKHTLKKKFEENPELLKLQSRKGKQNGRCIPIIIKDVLSNVEIKFDYIKEAAEYFIENKLGDSQKVNNSDYLAIIFSKCMKNNTKYNGYKILRA